MRSSRFPDLKEKKKDGAKVQRMYQYLKGEKIREIQYCNPTGSSEVSPSMLGCTDVI